MKAEFNFGAVIKRLWVRSPPGALFFLAHLPFSSPGRARVAKAGETYAPGGAHLGQGQEEEGAENRQRERHRGRDRLPREAVTGTGKMEREIALHF